MKLKFVNLKNKVHLFSQLNYEEILLRSSSSSYCIINKGPIIPTIVTGLSGKINELVYTNLAKSDSIPIIRRFSGGGTVIVDENTLFITFISDASQLQIQPYPRDIMKWSEEIYNPVFNTSNAKFSLRENDYILNDLKFGGNAQSISRNRFVHHTSFLWSYSPENMKYLQIPKKMPEYRQRRTHNEFLTPLHPYFSSIDEIINSLKQSLDNKFDLQDITQDEFIEDVEDAIGDRKVEELVKSKYENYDS